MAKNTPRVRSSTQAVNRAGASITSTRTVWINQLKRREGELRQLKFHLGNALSEARKEQLRAGIREKQHGIEDVKRRLARCKKPGARSTGFEKVGPGGRADGNDS